MFITVILAGLLAGVILGIWLGCTPECLSAGAYIEQQQNMIRQLNVLMPVLGAIVIIFTLFSTYLKRYDRPAFSALLMAIAFLTLTGLVTRFGNQPINAIVMTWKPGAPPMDWMAFRDKWWMLHTIRVVTSFCSFCLIAWASIRNVVEARVR